MRPSRPVGAVLLAVAGFGWLAFKAEYLRMAVPDGLKALIVSPSLGLLVSAAFVGFRDWRRLGAALFVLGILATLWLIQSDRAGFVLYGAYDDPLAAQRVKEWSAFASFLMPVGTALLVRRSPFGGFALGLALVTLAVAPSRLLGMVMYRDAGLPRRYAYYYFSPDRSVEWVDRAVPVGLATIGIALLFFKRRTMGRNA